MITIPSPNDVLTGTLVWLGVPSLVLLPLAFALAVVEWYRALRATASAVSAATRGVGSFWQRTPWLKVLSLVISGAATVASVFSLTRFLIVLLAADSPLHGGPQFRWQELWIALISYHDATGLPVNAALVTLGWVAAICITAAARASAAFNLLALVRRVVVPLAILSTVVWAVLFLMTWSLATWMSDPSYNLDMLAVYGTGLTLSLILTLGARSLVSLTKDLFQLPIASNDLGWSPGS